MLGDQVCAKPNRNSASADLHYIFCERPRCPSCGDLGHKMLRSVEQADGTRRQRRECHNCQARFVVIWQ